MAQCLAAAQVSCYHYGCSSERLSLPLSAATPTEQLTMASISVSQYFTVLLTQPIHCKGKVWTVVIAPLTWVRLVTSSALQSRKWQLIGMSQWCRSTLCGHPLPAPTDNWTCGAARIHRPTIAPISHTRLSPYSTPDYIETTTILQSYHKYSAVDFTWCFRCFSVGKPGKYTSSFAPEHKPLRWHSIGMTKPFWCISVSLTITAQFTHIYIYKIRCVSACVCSYRRPNGWAAPDKSWHASWVDQGSVLINVKVKIQVSENNCRQLTLGKATRPQSSNLGSGGLSVHEGSSTKCIFRE